MAGRLEAVAAAPPIPGEGFRRCSRTYLELALDPRIRRVILQDARLAIALDGLDRLLTGLRPA